MIKHNQNGAANGLVVSLIFALLLLLAMMVFAVWAFTGRQDYKNNVDKKISVAKAEARQQEATLKAKEFAEAAKNPLTTYQGPSDHGSLLLAYPKTWSGYVDASGNNSAVIDGYFNLGVVPAVSDTNSVFALRVQVLTQSYAEALESLASQQQSGKLSINAYALPKLPKLVGVKVTGVLDDESNVTMIILPLRSQSIRIWAEGNQYLDDFNTHILPNFSFSP